MIWGVCIIWCDWCIWCALLYYLNTSVNLTTLIKLGFISVAHHGRWNDNGNIWYLQDTSVAVEKKEGQTEGEARYDTACQRLASEAVRRGCADNVTVILVSIEFWEAWVNSCLFPSRQKALRSKKELCSAKTRHRVCYIDAKGVPPWRQFGY